MLNEELVGKVAGFSWHASNHPDEPSLTPGLPLFCAGTTQLMVAKEQGYDWAVARTGESNTGRTTT